MNRFKVTSLLTARQWNVNRKYNVDEVVERNGVIYQNTTGKQSEPGVGPDWIALKDDAIPIESVVAGTNITIDNTDPKNPIINSSGVSTVKRKQYLYFSFAGTNLNNASNHWWGTDLYMGHFNETYSTNASFTPTNNFSSFKGFYGVNRPAFFDCYVKNIYMSFANVGETYTFDVAFLNYKLSNGYNSSVGNGVTDRIIIGREANSVAGATGLKKFMDLSNINTTQLIQKGSCFRMFLNSGGYTNAGFGNPLFIVELEEA